MRDEVREALTSACGVEPTGVVRIDRGARLLGDWRTVAPDRLVRVTHLRRRILAFLRELPEDMTVADLRDELEEE